MVTIRSGNGEDGMKKRFCLSGLALVFLCLGVVHAQIPTGDADRGTPTPAIIPPSSPPATIARPPSPPPAALPAPLEGPDLSGPPQYPPGVSSWLAYPRPAGCCGSVGTCGGPIDSELYLRAGSAIPVASGLFGSIMKPGLDVEGGVRVLFFNTAEDGAWTADLFLKNMNFATQAHRKVNIDNFNSVTPNGLGGTNTTVIPVFPVTPSGLNDTTVNLVFGREFYLWGSTTDCKVKQPKWRAGFDLGGSWGSSKLDLLEIPHKTATVGGMCASIHTDIEVPCGCCIIYGGVRLEYGYLYNDILQKQNDTDLQTLSATLTMGLRY
jgi:hypothetical protein